MTTHRNARRPGRIRNVALLRFMMRPESGSRPSLQARLVAITWPARRDERWQPGYLPRASVGGNGRKVFGVDRLIVGTSGSPGSLQALRYAEGLAWAHAAVLIPVIAWEPPGGERAERVQPSGPCERHAGTWLANGSKTH
jgi:hypothetical protein